VSPSQHILDDLRDISEYVFFADAALALDVTEKHLKRVLHGKATLEPYQAAYLHEAAKKVRRREGQIRSIERAQAQREAKREIHDTLREIGKADLKIPENLPPFLRLKKSEYYQGSPVYVYDFSDISQNDVMQFFNFQKRLVPGGSFMFTYKILKGGIYPARDPRKRYVMVNDFWANTSYFEFCVNRTGMPADSCLVMSNLEFLEKFNEYNDASAFKKVYECAISYPRPAWTKPSNELTAEELADDIARGADPISGRTVYWSD
jgi:hypothetical protein